MFAEFISCLLLFPVHVSDGRAWRRSAAEPEQGQRPSTPRFPQQLELRPFRSADAAQSHHGAPAALGDADAPADDPQRVAAPSVERPRRQGARGGPGTAAASPSGHGRHAEHAQHDAAATALQQLDEQHDEQLDGGAAPLADAFRAAPEPAAGAATATACPGVAGSGQQPQHSPLAALASVFSASAAGHLAERKAPTHQRATPGHSAMAAATPWTAPGRPWCSGRSGCPGRAWCAGRAGCSWAGCGPCATPVSAPPSAPGSRWHGWHVPLAVWRIHGGATASTGAAATRS